MKKTLLFAAVVATTLASCSKNEITDTPGVSKDTKSINFTTATGLTRTNNNGITDLQNAANGFEVYGMKKANSDPTLLFTNSGNSYKWGVDKWAWVNPDATDKKWPTADTDYPLHFFSIFPVNQDMSDILDANYTTPGTSNWTLTTTQMPIAAAVESQEDYLMAITNDLIAVPTNGMAQLDFKHIMSNILFSIVTPEGYKIVINSLKIKNVKGDAADATFAVFDKVAANRGVWTDLAVVEGTKSYSYFASTYTTNTEVTGAVDHAAVPLYSNPTNDDTKKISPKLMPQANTASWSKTEFKTLVEAWTAGGGLRDTYEAEVLAKVTGAHIELTYAMVDDKGVCVVGQVDGAKIPGDPLDAMYGDTRFVTVAFPLYFDKVAHANLATPWQQGKKYTYNIRLGMPDSSNGVVTDPTYKDETGGSLPTEPVDNPAVTPGEDITNTERSIDFTVGTIDWTDEAGHDIR